MARHLGREGVSVGRRRVRRLMRLMGLEAVYRKPRTSAAQPGHRADITYIPVSSGFLYLVAVMDWASRHVLAWRLSNTMDTGFCIEALEAALRTGTPEIFNTDQGAHASPHFCRASDHAEDLSIHPLFHQHAPERLHQRTNGRIPDFPVTRSHPPASWPSAANSSICRTYRKTAGEESRRRSPVANRWMRP